MNTALDDYLERCTNFDWSECGRKVPVASSGSIHFPGRRWPSASLQNCNVVFHLQVTEQTIRWMAMKDGGGAGSSRTGTIRQSTDRQTDRPTDRPTIKTTETRIVEPIRQTADHGPRTTNDFLFSLSGFNSVTRLLRPPAVLRAYLYSHPLLHYSVTNRLND